MRRQTPSADWLEHNWDLDLKKASFMALLMIKTHIVGKFVAEKKMLGV